ncbi:MAG: TetR/AcrR family transcriptional regulator [Acidimicrobiales bacterium]
MPRVTEDYLDSRRKEIMGAAITCFSREGFHRTTMQDIVAETGLSAGAIYRYFPAKEDIVEAIAAEHHSREAGALADAQACVDIGGALRQLARVSLGGLTSAEEQTWRRVTVQVWAEALRNDRVLEIVRSGLDEPVEILADLFRRGQLDGIVSSELEPLGAARVCAAIFQGLVLQQAWNPELDVAAYVDAVLSLIDGLVRTAARTGPVPAAHVGGGPAKAPSS